MRFFHTAFIAAFLAALFLLQSNMQPALAQENAQAKSGQTAFFPLSAKKPENRWLALAFSHVARQALSQTDRYRPAGEAKMRSLANRLRLAGKKSLSFDDRDRIREALDAPYLFDGYLALEGTTLTVRAALIDFSAGTGSIDIRHQPGGFSENKIFEALDAFAADLLAQIGASRAALERETDNPRAFIEYWKAQSAREAGDAARARKFAQSAADLDPGYRSAQLLAARLEIETGKFNPAIHILEGLTESDKADAETLHLLGMAYYLNRKLGDAEYRLAAAFEMEPDNAEYALRLAFCLNDRYKRVEARKAFLTAHELDPENVAALRQLASLYAEDRDRQKTLYYLEKYLGLAGADGVAAIRLDQDYFWLKDDLEFIGLLKKNQ